MSTIIRKIGMGGKTLVSPLSGIAKAARGAALPLLIAASAILPARGDGLAITPTTISNAMQQVAFSQTFTATGEWGYIDYDNWKVLPWVVKEEASTYAVGSNETRLWEGAESFATNYVYNLPFDFPYCGRTINKIHLTTRGYIFLGNDFWSFYSTTPSSTYLANGHDLLMPLWTQTEDVQGFVDTSVDGEVSFRFEANGYTNGNGETASCAYRVTLKSDGTIRFSYRQSGTDTLGSDVRVVGFSNINYRNQTMGKTTDGIPTVDYVIKTTVGFPDDFYFGVNYNYGARSYNNFTIQGTPVTPGEYQYSVSVYDNSGNYLVQGYDFTVEENPDKEPVIDSFTPADTNTTYVLNIGDTMDFSVVAHDLADDLFDVNWKFYTYDDTYYASSTNLATGTSCTFEATRALYDFQRTGGEGVLKCIVSDAVWTNTVTWHVYIRRDAYVDASAGANGDGTEASPYNAFDNSIFKKGDKIYLAPGRYELDYMNLGSRSLEFVSTGSMDDTTIAFTSSYSLSGNMNARSSFAGISLENIQYVSYVNLANCSLSGISGRSYGIQHCNFSGCYVWGCSVSQNLFTDSTLKDCTVAGNVLTSVSADDDNYGMIGTRCQIENTIVANNFDASGVEANFNTDEWSAQYITATNCCTIPAMTDYGTGNYGADPMLVYPSAGDLRLKVGSPCINAENPANNTGAYKGTGVVGFSVHAFADSARGTVSPEVTVVEDGGRAELVATKTGSRDFKCWVTNGVEVAGATDTTLVIENIDCDYEVEAVFETKVFYVDAAAAGEGEGTEESPLKTISTAVSLAIDGETILLKPGRYVTDYIRYIYNKKLAIVSMGSMEDTTIVFTSRNDGLQGPSSAWLDVVGITFENVRYMRYVNLTDCAVTGMSGAYYGFQNCTLKGCYAWGNSAQNNLFCECDLKDCTIAGNALTSAAADSDNFGMVGNECNIENTIVASNYDSQGVEANFSTYYYNFYNTITATNCCTRPAMSAIGTGNFEADPLLVYPASGDLRLRVGSPCINAENSQDNIGAYKGPGVEGFTIHAVCDPVRGKMDPEMQVVVSGGSATVTAASVTNRVFQSWITNGVEVAGATTPTLTISNIDCDYEVEAIFETKEFYVDPNAEEGGDGTAALPVTTIAEAAALAIEGETINLAAGTYPPFDLSTYNVGWNTYTDKRTLTLVGAGADKTVIDGGFTNTCVVLGANMTLKNVAVVNGISVSKYTGGVYAGTIENCIVANCASRYGYSCYAAGVRDATIINSLIADNVNTNSSSSYAGGVYGCKVYNSTIANNLSTGYPGGANYSYLKNCIVYGNTARSGYSEYNEVRSCQNESLSTGVSDSIAAQSNLIGVDPWFVDAENGDYRLIAGSVAIDAGENVPQVSYAGATDLRGGTYRRIINGVVDYGCYEGGISTAKPEAPVATAESAKAADGVPLAWSAIRNAATYYIYRGTTDNPAAATRIGTTTATSYSDAAGVGGTTYYYWVSAYNKEFGEGEKFGPMEATAIADFAITTTALPNATEYVPYSVRLECTGNTGDVEWSLAYTGVSRAENSFDGTVGESQTASGWLGDDTGLWVNLPFEFPWYGKKYTTMYVSSNGFLRFGKGSTSRDWPTISSYPAIAVLLSDLVTTEMRVVSSNEEYTVVWKGNYYSSSSIEFSATLRPDGSVTLKYGTGNARGGVVGISGGTDDTKIVILDTTASYANMEDVVIDALPNSSGLELSQDGVLSGTPEATGFYQVSVQAHDTGYGDTASRTWSLTVDANPNTRPVIDSTTPVEGTIDTQAGETTAFAVTAHDPEGAGLSYKWYLNQELVATTSGYSFTPDYGGRYTLACEVADDFWTNGQVKAEWTINVRHVIYCDAASTAGESADGTLRAPFSDLTKALRYAMSFSSSGGVLLKAAPGTYAPAMLEGGNWGPYEIRSTGNAANTIIDGGGTQPCFGNYNYYKDKDTGGYGVDTNITLVGFTLQNGYSDNDWSPTRGGGGAFGANLKECVVRNCVGEGAGGAVSCCNLEYCTIINNRAGTGGGMDAKSTAKYSIIWGNTSTNANSSASANYAAGAMLTYCCTTPLPEGEGNITDDPLFTNLAAGDWSLQDGSPCLNPRIGCYGEGGDTPPPIGVTYTVTFDANGGTCATASRTVAKNAAIGTLPQATRAGYSLDGWYTAKTGGTKVSASYKVTKDITLYARWTELPKFTVTFDANGGTCATKTRKVTQGEAVGELPEATRDGWTLTGWFTAKTGGAQFTAADVVTKNITVYARWTEFYELAIDGNGVLTGLTGTVPATLEIPATVTAFGANLFKGATALKTATGGANVTKCGAGAFRDSGIWTAAPNNSAVVVCGVLVGWKGTVPATVEVPYGVKVIADGAFAGATTLTAVYLPDSLVSIGDGAFKGCTKLDDVIGLEGGVTVAADAFEDTLYATFRLAYDASGTVVTGFKGPVPAEIVIPDNVTAIGSGVFRDQTAITSVTIGANVMAIGSYAFAGCTGLATVTGGERLATIGASAFENCTSFTAFDIPAVVTTIGANAFNGCTALATVTGGGSVETIRTDAFAGTPWYDAAPAGAFEEVMLGHVLVRMKGDVPASYEISTNVWMVANNAFAGVTTLSDLYIGTEVVSLWDRAFAGCTSLGSVTVPSGCRELGDYLFDGCTSLTNVFFRGHAPTNDVPHVFAGTPATLTVRVKEGSRGWIEPGSDSDLVPARWPYKTGGSQLVATELNRAVYEPEEIPGVVRSVIVDGTITNDTTWIGGKVYEVQSGCTVEAGATLTIEAGAIVKLPLDKNRFYGTAGLQVHGKLVANGTLANPVVFTSIRDDSWGGDTNGDGDRSEPYPGECAGVDVGMSGGSGIIEARYAKFLYGHAGNRYGAGACLMLSTSDLSSSLYGCEFAHAAMDGCFAAGARFENCVFRDCDRGLLSISVSGQGPVAVNCVAYGNRVGFFSHTGDMYLTNCIAAFNSEWGISSDGCNVYSTRCCLWNPDGQNNKFDQYANLNKWWTRGLVVDNFVADPLFLDAENGDFRISVESPCVDAAYGEVAPMNDFYEQPRMDVKYVRNTGTPNAAGEYPDIGIYEVPGTTERPVMNLEVESVSFAPASAAPGETLTVNYTVRNTGNTAAKGSIRDVVRLKSAVNGGTMVAGTVTQLYNLEPGASVELTASVAVPSAPAGEWLVGIDVNPNRDVFEQNFLKNSLWTEDAVEVRLQEMSCGDGILAVTVPAGTTMGYVLADVPAEGGVVVITGGSAGGLALPVVARVATGHMPTAAMNDATSFVRADGSIVLVIPPRGSVATSATLPEVYLAIENTGVSAELINVTVQPLTTELWSVYPEEAANVGDMGFTFTGAGLTAASEFYLGSIRAKSVSVIDSANVYAVFNVQGISADRYYDVTADGKTIRDAVRINKVAKGPILEAKLELPERTRDNRVYTGYVVYENTGDTQMNAPTFIVNIAEASSTNTVIGAYDDDDDNLTLQRVLIVGLGSSHPAGVLKPGDSGRLPFKFRPVGSYQFKLDSRYTSDEVAGAVTRMNLRGGPVRFDGSSARGLANLIQKGEEAAAISGWLLDVRTREPLADAGLGLTLVADATGGSPSSATEPFVRTATTDENGYFSFEQLRNGAYQLSADVGYVLVTTNLITVAGQADVNGYEATALPPGVVTGYAMSDDGNPIQYGEVTLFAAAGDMVGTTVKTDGYGAYRFTGLEDGAYTVYAKPFESFRGVMVTNVVIEAAGRERRIDMELKRTARAYGTVAMYGGGTAVDGEVRLYDDEGNFLKADVATNGVWEAAGIPVGEYSFAYVSADGALDSARVVAAFAQGDEREIALEARPAIMFRASTRFGAIDTGAGEKLEVRFAATGYANNTNVVAVQWDFGEGEPVEVDEVETTHTYATTGYKTVRLRPKFADGTYGDWDETENYILVSAPVETIYKANAIVLQGFDDAGAVTNAGTLVVTGVGTNWLELAGTGDIPLEAGVVIAGSYTNAENEADWFVRKVVAVSGDAGGWRLATEYGDEDDLYEQYWSNWGFGAAEEEGGSGGASPHGAGLLSARGPARLMSGDKKKGFGDRAKGLLPKIYGEGGVTFNVMCSPDITCFYSYYRLNIKGTNYVTRRFRDYHEMVPEVYGDMHRELRIFGDVSLTANIDISAEYSGGWKKEYQYDLLPKVMKAAPQAAKIIPHFTIKAEAAGKIGGSLHGEASVIGYIDVGFTKETGKKIQWHKPDPFKGHVDMSFETAGEKEAAGKLHASVGAGFGVTMKVFEVLSATADVTFSAKAEAVIPSKGPSKASINIGYDTEIAMNFIDFSWLNADWKVGLDWSIEGLSFWGMEWISPQPDFIYRQPHEKEWPARITVTDRSKTGTFVRNNGRTEVLPITSVSWDYGQGQTYSYDKSQIDNGTYKRHRIIEFNEEGEYTVSLNVQGGIMPNIFPCQKKIKIKKPKEDEQEEQTKIFKDEWFGPHQNTQTSVDPNAMEGPLGVGANRYVKPGQEMTYTIYFENKSDAAIAAQEVFVDNPLSEYLDWSTFRMGMVSVGGQLISGLDGYTADEIAAATTAGLPLAAEIDQTNGLYKTRAEVMFDAATGVASWYIRVLDPAKRKAGELLTWPNDDTAGVLQPNLLPPDGEGYITYTVNVSSNAPVNAIIDNSADIVFDKNPVIVTDPAWWNTVAGNDVGFVDAELEVDEGGNVEVKVNGGNIDKASSVQLYLTYNTAAAADVDLKTGTIDDEMPKGGLKFPLTLSWAKGEIGEKVVAIPTKADKTVEDDEFFTLQLAAPNGLKLGEGRVCTVTIRDTTVATGKQTLQDAVNNAVVKMSTAGKGKWAYSNVGTGGEAEPGKTASASAVSPTLKAGQTADLKAAAVKGSGTLSFDVRVANPDLEGESPEAADGVAKTVLTLLDGKAVLLAWTNETDWTSASYTVKEEKATSHAFTWQVVQGVDTNAHAYVANVVWSPADTDMRAVMLAAEPAEGGTVAGAGVYPYKTKLSLVATANVGYEFIGWYDGETLFNAKAKPSVTATNDLALTARFEKIPYVRGLADPANGGKVSGSGLCARGKKVTLKATANKNFTFLGWVEEGADGDYVATTASLVIDRTAKPAAKSKTSTTITNVAEDVTYYAVFKSDPEVFVIVDSTDGTGAEPTGKGAGKYVAGTITGMGKYAPGKTKIALKAAANKGYVFAGWYDANDELLTKGATYTIASMGESDVEYTAKFVTADEDKASIKLSVAGEELSREPAFTSARTNFCGVAMNWQLAATALSATTIKVSGLPSGLKFTAKPVTSKVGSGKAAVTVTNVPANTIYGAPTAASKVDAKKGVVPSDVKITVTTAGKSSITYLVKLTVDPLPAWAVGTFDGAVEGGGIVQAFTIATSGKISGKILEGGKTWTLSAASFDVAEGDSFLATVIGKSGKELVTNAVTVTAENGVGVASGVMATEPPRAWSAYQNLWKRADTKAAQPVFKSNIPYELGDPGDANNTLKLTFKKDGVVAFAGKVDGNKVSGSSQLVRLSEDGTSCQVTLYAPPKPTAKPPFAGFCKTLAVALTLDEQSIVKDVAIGGGDAPAGSGSWFTGEFTGYGDAQFPIAGGDTEFLNGLFTINVASDLSFTGTFTGTDGTNATFSGTFAKQVADGATNYVASGVAITVRGQAMTMTLECSPEPYAGREDGFGEMWGGSDAVPGEPCIALNCAWQNIWKRGDLATEWKPAFAAGTEKTLDLKDTWLADLSDGDSLTYAFGADGTVSITGKIYGESVNATATLDLEGLDGSNGTMHCNFYFLANGHLYQQQFTFSRQATVTASDISLDSFVRID